MYDRHCEQDYELFNQFLSFDYPEAMALARHHSILSRLLDWTTDPMVAAFFSASKKESPNKICVWALNKRYLNANARQGQILFYEKLPTTGLEYLHLQKGLFTDMIGVEEYYYKYASWPTLDQYLLKTCAEGEYFKQENYLTKIELKASEINPLLLRLDRMGINKYSLMPTYDNVGQSILI